ARDVDIARPRELLPRRSVVRQARTSHEALVSSIHPRMMAWIVVAPAQGVACKQFNALAQRYARLRKKYCPSAMSLALAHRYAWIDRRCVRCGSPSKPAQLTGQQASHASRNVCPARSHALTR